MPDGIGISSYLMRQQNGLSLKTQHNSKVWTIVPLEPPKPLAPGARGLSGGSTKISTTQPLHSKPIKKPHLPKQMGLHQLKAKSA